MNRLNIMCDLEEKWSMACVYAGHCFPSRSEYHNIRDAIRYNSKRSAFEGRLKITRESVEKGLTKLLQDYYPQITDWKITLKELNDWKFESKE